MRVVLLVIAGLLVAAELRMAVLCIFSGRDRLGAWGVILAHRPIDRALAL